MNPEFECGVTACLLSSGRVLANASNCAAVIAGMGTILVHSATGRLAFAVSLLRWPVECYLGVRVSIDRSLFQKLAREPVDGCRALDELLQSWGLLSPGKERTVAQRSRGARILWRRQAVMLAIQVVALAAGIIIQAVRM